MLQNKISLKAFVLLFFVLNSCSDCNYVINRDHIESNCPFTNGFYFEELEVLTYKDGLPDSVKIERKIALSPVGEGVKRSKKIYFYKENINYEWHDITNSVLSRTLPIKMERGKWYKIRGLIFRGNPDRAALLKLNEEGELKVFGYSESKFY